MPSSALDCTSCGACCLSRNPRYVALLPGDRGREIPASAVAEIGGRRYLRMCGGRCAQLVRTPDARLVCAIYEARPEACRAFRAGSFECLRAREARLPEADALRFGAADDPADPPRAA